MHEVQRVRVSQLPHCFYRQCTWELNWPGMQRMRVRVLNVLGRSTPPFTLAWYSASHHMVTAYCAAQHTVIDRAHGAT